MPMRCMEHQDAFILQKTSVVIDPCGSNPMCKKTRNIFYKLFNPAPKQNCIFYGSSCVKNLVKK